MQIIGLNDFVYDTSFGDIQPEKVAFIDWVCGDEPVARSPEGQVNHAVLTSCYSSAGREEEARFRAVRLLKINPAYCVRQVGEDRFKDPEANERSKNAMRKAGVPDCPNA